MTSPPKATAIVNVINSIDSKPSLHNSCRCWFVRQSVTQLKSEVGDFSFIKWRSHDVINPLDGLFLDFLDLMYPFFSQRFTQCIEKVVPFATMCGL